MSHKHEKKEFPYSIVLFISIVLFALLFLRFKPNNGESAAEGQTVTNENGTQIIEIVAKGGYSPSSVNAKSDVDTILRVKTKGTFDCSSAISIPKLGISLNLPLTGSTDIPLGSQQPGTLLAGTCAMGMYNFFLSFN